jgi:hypothetical protein
MSSPVRTSTSGRTTRRIGDLLALTTNPSDEYTRDDWMQFVGDFTGDGWPDVINCSFSGNRGVWLYVNPKGESRRWDKHLVVPDYQSEDWPWCAISMATASWN